MNPLMLDFPSEFETERLRIRMPLPGDGEAMAESIAASFEELRRWMPWAQHIPLPEESEAVAREAHVKFLRREDLQLLLFLKESGRLIGSSGLHRIDWAIPKFEIGYWLDTRHCGRGYMTEAVRAIVAFAIEQFRARRIEIRCDPLNERSRAIPERLGFELEGILRNSALAADGQGPRDTCVYALTR